MTSLQPAVYRFNGQGCTHCVLAANTAMAPGVHKAMNRSHFWQTSMCVAGNAHMAILFSSVPQGCRALICPTIQVVSLPAVRSLPWWDVDLLALLSASEDLIRL